MPFGICLAPEVFQRKMNDLKGIEVIADDFLVIGFGDNVEQATKNHDEHLLAFIQRCEERNIRRRRSGQSVTASDFGSNGPRFESGRGRCVESLDKALYSHCPKEKPSH